ncbi:MAG: DUF5723 family protein [Balneolaceae bacterium]
MKQGSIILLLLCIGTVTAYSQPVVTPRNMALGGGGSTYITDYNSNFFNPANLMIQDREGTFSFGIGAGSFKLDAVQNYTSLTGQLDNAINYISVFEAGDANISSFARTQLLENNYPGNSSLSDHRTRYDATLLGMKWMRDNHTLSFAIRSRTSSNYRVGKGWYSSTFEENSDEELILDRSIVHRHQRLHEISFGYAESFQFLTGLTPRLDNFIIGIAPKLVLGGGYLNAEWKNTYLQLSPGVANRIESFSYDATGEFGASTIAYMNGIRSETANTQSFTNDIFTIDGVGAGLDIGVTYLLTLGSDLSAVRPDQQPTQRSLRLSFSMTDIGLISYNNSEISMSLPSDTTTTSNIPNNLSNEAFIGAKGQYIDFIEKYGEDNPFQKVSSDLSSFSTLLPMALHGGALLEINRIKIMGDISIGLTNNAFNSTKLISSVGMEIRPLQFMPLRGGIQFKAQRPDVLSVGTAIETKHWDFSVAAQFTPNSLISQPAITGISVATLQFHF